MPADVVLTNDGEDEKFGRLPPAGDKPKPEDDGQYRNGDEFDDEGEFNDEDEDEDEDQLVIPPASKPAAKPTPAPKFSKIK